MRRPGRLLAGLLGLALPGCLAFGYPEVRQLPAVAADAPDVRAFRSTLDVKHDGFVIAGFFHNNHDVRELPVVQAATEPAWDTSFRHYWLLFPVNGWAHRDLAVLLYRPGYQTVEVPPRPWWKSQGAEAPVAARWEPAPDLAAQQAALEKVVGRYGWADRFTVEVLRFAAQEYARLADSPLAAGPDRKDARDRLRQRAAEYDELARKRGGPE